MKPFISSFLRFSFWAAPTCMLFHDFARYFFPGQLYWVTSISFWFSFYLYLPLILGLVLLSGTTRAAVAGGFLASAGALIGTTIIGLTRAAWSMELHQLEPALVQTVIYEPVVFFSSRMPGILFPIGLLILSFTLKKAKVLSRPAWIIFALGCILFPVGRISGQVLFNVLGDVLQLSVLGMLAFAVDGRIKE